MNGDTREKYIMAVSLEDERRHKAQAVYNGTLLAITHCVPIIGAPSAWLPPLAEDLRIKHSQGFALLVEDRTRTFPDMPQFSFDQEEDGRTMMQHCLERYFAMQNMGRLLLDPSVERLALRTGDNAIVNARTDDKGRLQYEPDWLRFNGAHKAILMCVAAAVLEHPLSSRWLTEFGAFRPQEKPTRHPLASFFAATLDRIIPEHEAFESAREARQAALAALRHQEGHRG